MRILIVEDEKNLSHLVKLNLELKGHEVELVEDGLQALEKTEQAYFDLIVLDLMLPKLSGMDVLSRLRLKNNHTPVIITSAKDTSTDRINGLKQGADDYLTKPYDIEELELRINNLVARRNPENNPIGNTYTFGENFINFQTFEASHKDKSFDLSLKETMILKYLISKKNEVVSRQDILKNVWGYDVYPSTRTIDNFIAALRKHFEENIKDPKYIKSVRGVGYKFVE